LGLNVFAFAFKRNLLATSKILSGLLLDLGFLKRTLVAGLKPLVKS